jgi:hypothetical protein
MRRPDWAGRFRRERLMKRSLTILIVSCVVVVAVVAAMMLRGSHHHEAAPFSSTDSSGPSRGQGIDSSITPEEERELHRITTLGYVAGSVPVPSEVGVVRHSRDAYDGYTLFTFAEGDEAVLIDMDGNEVFSWSLPGAAYWSRAHVYPNGDLLVLTADPYRLMKIDRNSRLIWRYEKPAHHDFDVLPDGRICVLVRQVLRRPDIHDGAPILDDAVAIVDQSGRELESVSLLEAFERSKRYGDWLEKTGLGEGPDIFHTNSVQVIQRGGHTCAMVSMRNQDTMAVLDMETREIIWAITGPWHMQHEARFVDGHLLFFDNLGMGDQSRVLEIDPDTEEVLWSYTAKGFLSRGAGAEQRLPNGNTLITESEKGRIMEVTPSGVIVWEYINPKTIDRGRELVLGIMRAERIPGDFPTDWAVRS